MKTIGVSLISNVLNAAVISLLFFVWSDYINKPPNLNGHWIFVGQTEESSAVRYKNMKVTYEVTLLQNGNAISGYGEKLQDQVGAEVNSFEGKARVPIEISGNIDHNYLSRDTLTLIYKESGTLRASSTVQQLVRYSDQEMHGTFESTIASSRGKVDWRR